VPCETPKETKESRHKLEVMKVWDWFSDYCSKNVNFLDASIDSRSVIGLIAHILSCFKEDKFIPIVKQCLKFVLPTTDKVPWVLKSLLDKAKVDHR
jgi:hypothetical protein